MSQPVKIFISYARKDAEYKEELLVHLSPLLRDEDIIVWHDNDTLPGEEFDERIKKELANADIVLFLISPNFLASEYIRKETQQVIERHSREGVTVVPIWIKPIAVPDKFLERFQSLPKDRKPVSKWADHDEAWVDVVRQLYKLFESKKNNTVNVNDINNTVDKASKQSNSSNLNLTPPQQIRNLISKGKTKDAIEQLIEYTANNDPDKNHEALLLSSRWNGAERQERLGLMSYGEIQMERNRINASLLAILEDLE